MSDVQQEPKVLSERIPKPVGYKLLCAVPKLEDRYECGLIKPDMAKYAEEVTTMTLYVVAMGPDAYKDPAKFPTGPWCKVGDFVVCRAYSGTKMIVDGKPFVMISDDMVEGTVEDPRGVRRA